MIQHVASQLYKFIAVGIIALFIAALPFEDTYAQEAEPTTLRLDLNHLKRDDPKISEEDDTMLSSFTPEELLNQVQMSEQAKEIVNNINDAVVALTDFRAHIEVRQVKDSRTDILTGVLTASVIHMAARLEVNTPSALRGQIYVVDQESMEARIYMPVTNQITIQKIEDMGEEVASTLKVTDLTSLFDFSDYTVEVNDILQDEYGVVHYHLELTGYENHVQLVKVNDTNWIPYEIIVYEGEVLMGNLLFSEVELDQDIPAEHIYTLPTGARELRM